MWNQQAILCSLAVRDVITIRGCTVKEFNGIYSVSVNASTIVDSFPDIPEVNELNEMVEKLFDE